MKNDNKGFSLIELIVVIAIMAILVGAIAPQVTKYIQRARESADIQAAGTLYTAMTVTLADPLITPPTLPVAAGTAWSAVGNDAFKAAVIETLGVADAAAYNNTFKSNKYKGKVPTVAVAANGGVTITIAGEGANLTVDGTGAKETGVSK